MRKVKGRRFREWLSIQIVQNPSRVILMGIFLINLLFVCVSAFLISKLMPPYITNRGFWPSLFYTISMIMDAGCVSYIVADVGKASAAVIILCVIIILVGMVVFTGGIIGYVSNQIASFIDNSNAGRQPLILSDHTIILNWNNRASEIVNEMIFNEEREVIVVMVSENKKQVEEEIENRLADTINRINRDLINDCKDKGMFASYLYMRRNRDYNKPIVIVRQGDTFSHKQLMDISVDKAKAVIIMSKDRFNSLCKYDSLEVAQDIRRGDSITVKTLVLVAELTAAESSRDNQKIIVEVEDSWTENVVQKIIKKKEAIKKCNIVPIKVNKVLGQLLAQFSIMPELNLVYSELFSNKGAEFYSLPYDEITHDKDDCMTYLKNHKHAIPLVSMDTKSGKQFFFMAERQLDLKWVSEVPELNYTVKGNPDLWQHRRRILILGHNSKILGLMEGFNSYRNEWNLDKSNRKDKRDILDIHVIDDKKSLEKINYFNAFSYVTEVTEADIYDEDKIYDTINRFIDDKDGDTAILILSDDSVSQENLDASALTYLIYVQDVLSERKRKGRDKDRDQLDVIVEILNPKNYDVVISYSVDNVVISNRYISKMMTQIGEKDALFEFYQDILTYDDSDTDIYESMELYIKKVGDVFLELPKPCSAMELIRAIYIDNKSFGSDNHTLLLGYISEDKGMTIFSGDQSLIPIELKKEDKLILFSNH